MHYSEQKRIDILDEICEDIINGASLRTALIKHKPLKATHFFRWLREDEAKRDQYARATVERAELMFEDMFDIADDGKNDWMEKFNEKGESVGWALNGENIQRSRVRIDTRKWALSKMMPKKYGEKLDLTTDGQPLKTSVPTIVFVDKFDDADSDTQEV